jgi:hypothetical protein
MGSATTELAIPSLEDLYRMTTVPDQRVVIRDVDWSFYERLVDSIPPRAHIHVDYDGKDLEIMSPSPVHDGARKLMGQLAEAVAQVLRIPYKSLGQTTWKRKEKVSRSSSTGWGTTVRITPSTKAGSCRSVPKKSGAGLLTKTPTMSRPGQSDSAHGSRPNWCRDGLGDHPDSACIMYSSRE